MRKVDDLIESNIRKKGINSANRLTFSGGEGTGGQHLSAIPYSCNGKRVLNRSEVLTPGDYNLCIPSELHIFTCYITRFFSELIKKSFRTFLRKT